MKLLKFSAVATCVALFTGTASAAVYQVEDLGPLESTRNSFAHAINEHNNVAASAIGRYQLPIDLSNFDMEALKASIEAAKKQDATRWEDLNYEEIEAGTVNTTGREFLTDYLVGRSTDSRRQKYGDRYGFVLQSNTLKELQAFDTTMQDVDSLSRSVVDQITGINDNDWVTMSSTAPFYKVQFTPAATDATPNPDPVTFWQRDFYGRAVLFKGDDKVVLAPPFVIYGGASAAFDISNSGYVVGYVSTGFVKDAEDRFRPLCINEETETRPDLVCVWESNNVVPLYQLRAYRWKLNSNGLIEDAKSLGMLYVPADDDERGYTSSALSVNEAGIAVGYSPVKRFDDNTFATTYPAIFKLNDEIVDFINHDDYLGGYARDINDNNIVVGEANKTVNGIVRSKFYVYNMDNEQITFPQDFFTGSSSVARAVNNAGQVVGEGEVESDLRTRRRNGFLYDIGAGTFENLNDLTTCNNTYTIVEARDINESGVIAATALIKVPDRDVDGNIKMKDGVAEQTEVARAVRLVPIPNGTKDDCSTVTEKPTRKGGSWHWGASLLLLTFGLRRRTK